MALDRPGGYEELVGKLCSRVDGFKLGLPLLMARGPGYAGLLRRRCRDALWVADLKLADIGYVMRLTAGLVAEHVDAVIAHGFVGVEGALGELKDYLDSLGKRLVVVASMSHPGAREAYDHALPRILETLERLRPWGVVAPATRPGVVGIVRRRLGPGVAIMSPGVGAQGAEPGSALCAGADYEIVGRAITGSGDPVEAAERIRREQEARLSNCRGTSHGS